MSFSALIQIPLRNIYWSAAWQPKTVTSREHVTVTDYGPVWGLVSGRIMPGKTRLGFALAGELHTMNVNIPVDAVGLIDRETNGRDRMEPSVLKCCFQGYEADFTGKQPEALTKEFAKLNDACSALVIKSDETSKNFSDAQQAFFSRAFRPF